MHTWFACGTCMHACISAQGLCRTACASSEYLNISNFTKLRSWLCIDRAWIRAISDPKVQSYVHHRIPSEALLLCLNNVVSLFLFLCCSPHLLIIRFTTRPCPLRADERRLNDTNCRAQVRRGSASSAIYKRTFSWIGLAFLLIQCCETLRGLV
jgi:hypothetical protein